MLHKLLPLKPLSLSAALALAAAGTASFLPAAEAALFNFSYTLLDGSLLEGMMEGDIQADGDTVFVSAVTMPMFNGAPGPDVPSIGAVSAGGPPPTGQAVVSLSGSTMDIFTCTDPTCFDGFLFGNIGIPAYASGPSYGAITEPYNSANWTLTQKSVPEPSAIMGLVAVGVLGAASRRQRQ